MKPLVVRGIMVGLATAAVAGMFAAPAGAATTNLRGDGTRAKPYMADCDKQTSSATPSPSAEKPTTCTVTFPPRTVKPLDSERLDYYRCPLDYFYLARGNYSTSPSGANIAGGIEIRGIAAWGIDARVDALFSDVGPVDADGKMGPTGPTGPIGTVTNWNTDPRNYGVTLHCTNDLNRSYRGYNPIWP